jgi:penicillin-binding protein 1B
MLYAMLIERAYDKRTILEAYSTRSIWASAARRRSMASPRRSEFWFGRDLRDLSTEQIALLVGIVRGPSLYDPRRNPERAMARRNFALARCTRPA